MVSGKSALVLFVLVMASSNVLGANSYSVSLLPSPAGATFSSPYGVSPFGIAGESYLGDFYQQAGTMQPAVWTNKQPLLLSVPQGFGGRAFAINAQGDAIGYVHDGVSSNAQPALWQEATLYLLPTSNLFGGTAYSINDSGTIAGSIYDFSGNSTQSKAVLWSNQQVVSLGDFSGAQSWSPSINNQGQALVLASYASHTESWIWTNGSIAQITSPTSNSVAASAINNQGVVAGTVKVATDQYAPFSWQNGTFTLMPELAGDANSAVTGLNDSSQIIGYGLNDSRGTYALLWENSEVFDLNDLIPVNSGWVLKVAQAIGNDGSIVGYGEYNGQLGAFLLTPATSPSGSTPTPEPATAATLLLAAPLLLCRRRQSV